MSQNGEFYLDTELNTDGVKKGAEEINKAVEGAAKSASDAVKEMSNSVSDTMHNATQSAQQAARDINEALHHASDGLPEGTQEAVQESKGFIRDFIDGFKEGFNEAINTEGAVDLEKNSEAVERFKTKCVTAFKKVGSVAKNVFLTIGSFFVGFGQGFLKGVVDGLGKAAKRMSLFGRASNTARSKLAHLIKAGLGITTLVVLCNRLRGAIKTGLDNLVKYDKETNRSVSSLVSSLATLKNALATAFAPIINVVSPILTSFINQLISVVNTIGMVIARLTGRNSFTKATAVQKDYAASLDKTSKAANKQTLAIDELNQSVSENASASGGGGAAAGDMFETVPISDKAKETADWLKSMWDNADFTELGTAVADKINGALQNIDWTTIKANAAKAGKSLATFLNGVFEEELNGITFGRELGITLGEAINTGIEFAYAFVTNFHWESFGQFIADGFKGALETIEWKKLAKTISGFVNGFLKTLITFFSDKKLWQDLGKSIGLFFSGIDWKETWFNLKKLASAFFKAVKTTLDAWLKENPDSFKFVVNVALTIGAVKILSKLGKAFLAKKLATALGGELVTGGAAAVGGLSLGTIALGAAIVIGAVAFVTNYDEISNQIDGLVAKIKGYNDVSDYQRDKAIESAKAFSTLGYALGAVSKDTEMQTAAIQNMGQVHEAEHQRMIDKGNEFAQSVQSIGGIIDTVSTTITGSWETLKMNTDSIWGELAVYLSTRFEEIKTQAELVLVPIKDRITSAWNTLKENTSETWRLIKDDLTLKWTKIRDDGTNKITELKGNIVNRWAETKSNTDTTWRLIKDNLGVNWTGIRDDGTQKFGELKNGIILSFAQAARGIKNPIQCISDMTESMANNVADGFNHIAEAIKEITTFDWTNPLTGEHFHSDGIQLTPIGTLTLAPIKALALGSLGVPMLANGTVVPRSASEFMAVLGDNNRETEVVSPLSTIQEAVANVLVDELRPLIEEIVNNTDRIAEKELSVEIGDKEIARAARRGESQLGYRIAY